MLKTKTLAALVIIAILSLILATLGVFFITAQAAAEDSVITVTGSDLIYSADDAAQVVGANLPLTGQYKVVIPEGVTSIGANAFETDLDNATEDKAQLVEVELPSSLTNIGAYAFAGAAISSVNIPANVTEIGQHAFHGCASLVDVAFAERTADLNVRMSAFERCAALRTISLPDNTTVYQSAFKDCTSLLFVYAGSNCLFDNTSGMSNATFFPANNKELKIIFANATAYHNVLAYDETFNSQHGDSATYVIKVNCYVGASSQPIVYERLFGQRFNYVRGEGSAYWNTDTSYSKLPAQDASYLSTTWYSDSKLTDVIDYDDVNGLLSGATSEINLYCHETVLAPEFPAEPASWVFSDDKSYDISDKAQVLQALGCEQTFSAAQLAAMDINVVFANEKGEVAETPAAINANGVYSVTVALNPAYGKWAQTVNPSVTVNVDTTAFNIVLIVFLILGTIGMIATASTAIIRKKVQDRNKRKQLTQKEILDKYKAIGGETTLFK